MEKSIWIILLVFKDVQSGLIEGELKQNDKRKYCNHEEGWDCRLRFKVCTSTNVNLEILGR